MQRLEFQRKGVMRYAPMSMRGLWRIPYPRAVPKWDVIQRRRPNLKALDTKESEGSRTMKLTIEVKYRTPSLNVTKRQHWTQQYREKRRAFSALASALWDTGHGLLTPIISLEVSKTCSMAYATLSCWMATSLGASSSKRNKPASARSPRKKQSLRLTTNKPARNSRG